MRSSICTASLSCLLAVVCVWAKPAAKSSQRPPEPGPVVRGVSEDGVTVFFSPEGGCLAAVVSAVDGAKRSLDVQAYLLTTEKIAGPIARAYKRGVKVRILMDADNAGPKYSAATYLSNAGLPVMLDAEHKEAHNKVMLIDGRMILTGSFNFTLAAEKENAENLLVIENKPRLYAVYEKNFETHLRHSKPYENKSR